MSGWVDFRELRQGLGIEQVLGKLPRGAEARGAASAARALSLTDAWFGAEPGEFQRGHRQERVGVLFSLLL